MTMSSEFVADFAHINPRLVKSIQETGFLDTCEIHLKEVKGVLFKYDVDEIMRYSDAPIGEMALTHMPDTLLGNLKFVQSSFLYLPEQQQANIADTSTKLIHNLLAYVHSIGLQSFVDEVYVQTIKQLRMCTDLFLQTYYSNILIMLSSAYMPSKTWYIAILNCLFLGAKTLEDYIDYQPNIRRKLDLYLISQKVAENCRMALFRMIATFSAPQRNYPPTL